MKKKTIISFFLLILGIAVYAPLQAQSDCEKALIAAENLYQSGQLYDVANKILPCLEIGFNFQEKQNAYRLLILTYLNINKEEKAKDTFHKLLKLNPDYVVVKGKDPIELFNLYQQFNVDPVFYVGLRGGITLTQPYILSKRSSSSISGEPDSDKAYNPFYGFMIGGDFAFPLFRNLLLEISPAYVRSSYLFESQYLTDGFAEGSEMLQVQEVSGRETYQNLVLPLTLHLRMPSHSNKLYYTFGVGAGASFLLSSAYHDVTRENKRIFTEEITISKIPTSDFRRSINVLTHLEIGLEYKYLGYFLGGRAGISSALLNYTQYQNQQEMFLNTMSTTFGWLDDDFVLANGYFTLFVRKPLYRFL